MEIYLALALGIMILAFFCEYMDSTLGMGYGTTMTPLLLLCGFQPIQIVPAVLLSELITGVLAGIMHGRAGNVNFSPKTLNIKRITHSLKTNGWWLSFRKGIPRHFKIVILLVLCSIAGAVSAVFTAKAITRFWQQIYIGGIVILMGLIIIIFFNKVFRFSWIKIFILGIVASFNKGLTGGGYGPLVVSGQLVSGVESKNAVGITSLAEGLTSLVGVVTYMLTISNAINWKLALAICTGAICSVPFSVKSVQKIDSRMLKLAVAALTIILGIITIIKTLKDCL